MDLPTKEVVMLNSEQSPVNDSVQKKNRIRKRPKAMSKIEKSLGIVMDKFVSSQHETEDKYIELEEKRLKLMQELEERRQDIEEKRHERDRQHELQLWSMFMQAIGGSGTGGPPRFNMPYNYYPTMPGNSPEFWSHPSSLNNSYPPSPS